MPSSSAPAASCPPPFSRVAASKFRPNMARSRLRPARSALAGAVCVLLGVAAGSAQQLSSGSPADAALRAGQFDRAAALLEQQAKAGDAEAQYKLASPYRLGRGVETNDAAAFRWMKAAAEYGHAEAQINLAKMYLAGRGVAVDLPQARAWLAKVASTGRAEAAELLAQIAAQSRRDADRQVQNWS